VGEEGVETMLMATIEAGRKLGLLKQSGVDRVIVDTTVMPKAVARKARTPYEFGVKVTVATTLKEGFVVGMRSLPGNPYDGHALGETIEQVSILADHKPRTLIVDRGVSRSGARRLPDPALRPEARRHADAARDDRAAQRNRTHDRAHEDRRATRTQLARSAGLRSVPSRVVQDGRSTRSSDSISSTICQPTLGSPGALVSNGVSRGGIRGGERISA
jgi:hypothetical protein